MLQNTQTIGKFVVTSLTKVTDGGDYAAAVSIRRGVHDRVIRFIPRFQTSMLATRYAMRQGRSMVLQNQLA